jgi:hypothetical protein
LIDAIDDRAAHAGSNTEAGIATSVRVQAGRSEALHSIGPGEIPDDDDFAIRLEHEIVN